MLFIELANNNIDITNKAAMLSMVDPLGVDSPKISNVK